MNKLKSILLYPLFMLILLIPFTGCEEDDNKGVQSEDNKDNNEKVDTGYEGASTVHIMNEGTFNQGNASLTVYEPGKGVVRQQYFRQKNDRPLGDVFHSMLYYQTRGFLVINNSGKIEVVDTHTFNSLGTIRNLPSPRYIQPLGNGKGYVTNFTQGGSSEVSIIDMNAYEKTGQIPTSGWTEQMVKVNQRIWVAEVNLAGILIIDPQNHSVTDTVLLKKQIQQLAKDEEGYVWTLANGGIEDDRKPVLYKIDPHDRSIAQQWTFPSKDNQPGNLTFNQQRDTLYFLDNGIYRMPINASQLPDGPLIKAPTDRNFYGLGMDPYSQRIWVSDALDYVQKGLVFVYEDYENPPGDTIKAGVIPRDFRFVR